MLEYDRFDMSKGNDVNKTNESRRCINISNDYYFPEGNFKFQPTKSMRWLS